MNTKDIIKRARGFAKPQPRSTRANRATRPTPLPPGFAKPELGGAGRRQSDTTNANSPGFAKP